MAWTSRRADGRRSAGEGEGPGGALTAARTTLLRRAPPRSPWPVWLFDAFDPLNEGEGAQVDEESALRERASDRRLAGATHFQLGAEARRCPGVARGTPPRFPLLAQTRGTGAFTLRH